MHASESESSSSPIDEAAAHSPALAPSVAQNASKLWLLALGFAALGALAAWAIGENSRNHFVAPTVRRVAMGIPFDAVTAADEAINDRRNADLTFTVIGATLGLALGLAGGLARRSTRGASIAGLVGLVLGGAAAFGSADGLFRLYFQQQLGSQEEFSRDLILPILIHGGIWAAIGAAAGLALAIGLGVKGSKIGVAVLGGLIGGALGAAGFQVIGALLFPNAHTNKPLSVAWPPRLLAVALGSVVTAALATFALLAPGRRKA